MIVDIHIHAGAPGRNFDQGCYISPRLRRSLPFLGLLALHRVSPRKISMAQLLSRPAEVLEATRDVDLGVLLALDAVYQNGRRQDRSTHFYTANTVVADLAKKYRKALFGASVHPERADAVELLEKCKEEGAVLVKWLPSTQIIDPAQPKYRKFYEKLAQLKLPLLCHVGAEHTLPSTLPRKEQNRLNDPAGLELALDCGVTVIAAHCALWSVPFYDPRHFPRLLALFAKAESQSWNLYGDVSAFCLPNRIFQVTEVKREINPQYLLLGSDYPIPPLRLSHGFSPRRLRQELPDNPIDRNLWLLRDMGFAPKVFTNAAKILSLPREKRISELKGSV